ncbi:MAG: YciI family protein [Gammaproteobacteria bacterium]
MLYAIIGEDAPDSLPRRAIARPAHLARAQALVAEGRMILAGPFPAIESNDPGAAGFTGSLIVAEFDSQSAAEAWIRADPYVTEGVFSRVEVRPFRQVLP